MQPGMVAESEVCLLGMQAAPILSFLLIQEE